MSTSPKEHSLDLAVEDVGDGDVAISVLVTTTVGVFPGEASVVIDVLVSEWSPN